MVVGWLLGFSHDIVTEIGFYTKKVNIFFSEWKHRHRKVDEVKGHINIDILLWISGLEKELFPVPRKLKEAFVTAERRKRIFLCEMPTIQMELENLNYAESQKIWGVGDATQISEWLQKRRGNAVITGSLESCKKNYLNDFFKHEDNRGTEKQNSVFPMGSSLKMRTKLQYHHVSVVEFTHYRVLFSNSFLLMPNKEGIIVAEYLQMFYFPKQVNPGNGSC